VNKCEVVTHYRNIAVCRTPDGLALIGTVEPIHAVQSISNAFALDAKATSRHRITYPPEPGPISLAESGVDSRGLFWNHRAQVIPETIHDNAPRCSWLWLPPACRFPIWPHWCNHSFAPLPWHIRHSMLRKADCFET
jgi:hypothetical protein